MFGFGIDSDDYPYSALCEECGMELVRNEVWLRQLCIECRIVDLTPEHWEWKFLLEISEWAEQMQHLR